MRVVAASHFRQESDDPYFFEIFNRQLWRPSWQNYKNDRSDLIQSSADGEKLVKVKSLFYYNVTSTSTTLGGERLDGMHGTLFSADEKAIPENAHGPCCRCASREAGAEERAGSHLDIASEFLLKTLVPKPALREVGGISFITACTWRTPVKDLQIDALRILKRQLPQPFIDLAGAELVKVVKKLHGDAAFKIIVPVPCGHSQRDDCLSYRLALTAARELDIGFSPLLEAPFAKGSSHPQQSRKFQKPRAKAPVKGKALVIDDVCTTGRHMSLSIQAMREAGADASGIAWIGSR